MEEAGCLICGRKEANFVLSGRDRRYPSQGLFKLVRCKTCGFFYQNPRPTLEEIINYYPEDSYYSYQHLAPTAMPARPAGKLSRLKGYLRASVISRRYRYPIDVTLKAEPCTYYLSQALIESFLGRLFCHAVTERIFAYKPLLPYQPAGRLLEIGCGCGTTLKWYQDHGWEVAGVELSQSAAKNASKIGINVFCGSIEQAGFADDYFDAVILFDTIEHLHNLKEMLYEIRRVLKKEGRVFITTQNISSLEFKLFRRNWPALDLPRHLYDFDARSLKRLLSACGFVICNLGYTVWPGVIVECMGFLEEDLRERKRQARRCLVGMLLKHKAALLLFWRPLAMFLYFVGLSGGLKVVAKPKK